MFFLIPRERYIDHKAYGNPELMDTIRKKYLAIFEIRYVVEEMETYQSYEKTGESYKEDETGYIFDRKDIHGYVTRTRLATNHYADKTRSAIEALSTAKAKSYSSKGNKTEVYCVIEDKAIEVLLARFINGSLIRLK